MINGTAVVVAAEAKLEIRNTAENTYPLWLHDAQVGADETVSDSGL